MDAVELTAWSDLEAHLRTAGRTVTPFSDESGTGVAFQLHHGGMSAACTARPVAYPGDKRWLAVTVSVCRLPGLKLRGALVANTVLPVGALAVWKEHVVLRQLLPLARLRPGTLEHTLRALVETAAALRSGELCPYALR